MIINSGCHFALHPMLTTDTPTVILCTIYMTKINSFDVLLNDHSANDLHDPIHLLCSHPSGVIYTLNVYLSDVQSNHGDHSKCMMDRPGHLVGHRQLKFEFSSRTNVSCDPSISKLSISLKI